jgi:hypothetical protein
MLGYTIILALPYFTSLYHEPCLSSIPSSSFSPLWSAWVSGLCRTYQSLPCLQGQGKAPPLKPGLPCWQRHEGCTHSVGGQMGGE